MRAGFPNEMPCFWAANSFVTTRRVHNSRTRHTKHAAPGGTSSAKSVSAYSFLSTSVGWFDRVHALPVPFGLVRRSVYHVSASYFSPLPRAKASRGPETWRLVGKNRAHGVDVGEDAAISERSPISQRAASGSSPLNPHADRLKIRTSFCKR